MKKRMVSIFLAVIMLLTLLPTVALAGAPAQFDPCNGKEASGSSAAPAWGDYVFLGWYTARTGGKKVTSGFADDTTYYAHWQVSKTNKNLVLTEGLLVTEEGLFVGADEEQTMTSLATLSDDYGLSFTKAENGDPAKLTMTNAVIDTYDGVKGGTDSYAALHTWVDLTIDLKGETVVCKGKGSGDNYVYGIYADNALSVTGDTLTAAGGDSVGEGASSFGIYAGTDLTNSATLTAMAGAAGDYSYGIDINGGKLTNSGTLTATAGAVESSYSIGIWAPSGVENQDNGTLTATAGDAGEMSYGINVPSGNLINKGTLTATAGDAVGDFSQSYGIQTQGEFLKNEGTLTVTAGDAGMMSYGIQTGNKLENKGTLIATAGTAKTEYGIYAGNFITVTGGAVVSYGEIKGEYSGITADSATVIGANETFVSGTTLSLTQKVAGEPIIIACTPLFAPCNGEPLMAGNKTAAPLTAPTREGYTFLGWYTAAAGGEKIESGFQIGTIYYAHWREDRSCGLTALLAIAVATAITVRSINQAAKLVLGAPMALALTPQVLRTLNRVVFWQRFF